MDNIEMDTSENTQKYNKKSHQKFANIMASYGYEVRDYKGRYFYEGPAVNTNDLQGTLAESPVKCQWDQLGLGYVVYPI